MKAADTKALLTAVALSISIAAPCPLLAQEISCVTDDSGCLQRLGEAACRERDASRSACEAWLRRLENHPDSDEVNWQLARGWIHMYLADFATVSGLPDFGSVSAAEARAYRATAADIFRDTAAQAPDNIEALGSVAATSENSDERIRLLRQIVAIDPAAFTSVQLLARELLLQSEDAAVYLEAAGLYEAAYEHVDFVPRRWGLATQALDFYERSGNASRREAFEAKWAADIHVDTALTELASAIPVAEKQQLLSTLCDRYIQATFGSDRCLELVESAMRQVPVLDDAEARLTFSEHVVSIMAMVAETTAAPPDTPSLKEVYKSHIESLIAMGVESSSILNDYATFLLPEEQVPVLEKAVALAPEDGDVRYRLAQVYGVLGRWDEAAKQFRAARDYIEEWKRPYLEQQLQTAERLLPVQ